MGIIKPRRKEVITMKKTIIGWRLALVLIFAGMVPAGDAYT